MNRRRSDSQKARSRRKGPTSEDPSRIARRGERPGHVVSKAGAGPARPSAHSSSRAHRVPSGAGRAGVVTLPPHLETALQAGHPWIYRDHVTAPLSCATGSWVEVCAGRTHAFALWDAEGAIALRIYSRQAAPTSDDIKTRICDAHRLREGFIDSRTTTAYRWVNGEGDALPGIIVDRYGAYAVVALDSVACLPLLPAVADALMATPGIAGVVRKRRVQESDGGERLELLAGSPPPSELIVLEHGLQMRANLYAGQKTGLFLDQRENRRLIGHHARGLRVLNLFSYTGAFSLYAAQGGAQSTVSVDIAKAAASEAEASFQLNGLMGATHEFVVADVFDYLGACQSRGEHFDLIICDPPSFAHNQTQLRRALNAYVRVNAAAMRVLRPGGLYAAASCTARVSEPEFSAAVAEAARKARCDFQLLAARSHAPDHPVHIAHPEQRYLKFLLGRVTPRR